MTLQSRKEDALIHRGEPPMATTPVITPVDTPVAPPPVVTSLPKLMTETLVVAPDTLVRVTLTIPATLYDVYASEGAKGERTPEDEMALRLKHCVDYTSARSLYFDDEQRTKLERALGGHLIRTPGQLITRLTHVMSVKVEDVNISLPANILDRLKTRVTRGQTLSGSIEKWVREGLERVAGLRPW